MMSPDPDPLDPRPQVDDAGRVHGLRCEGCHHVTVHAQDRCPTCGGELTPTRFPGTGVVWAATVVRIPIPGREPPFGLAYVDLDHGPRLLAHVRDATAPLVVGTRVVVAGRTEQGDVEVVPR
jgi:uncharacterized protein